MVNWRRIRRLALWLLIGVFVSYAVGREVVKTMGALYHGARAPYLQMPAADAMTLRWQTVTAEQGVVKFGTSPGQWLHTQTEPTAREEHEIRLTGLQPSTRYYYSVGNAQQMLYGADATHWFETAPVRSHPQPIRFIVLGDPGYAAGGNQAAVMQAVNTWLSQHPRPGRHDVDFILSTGDQAYASGSNTQFQENFFVPYQSWLQHVPIWPTYGNHDARRYAYFHIFSLPEQAQSGGTASGTEHYYSFDYAALHVVVLDSEDSSMNQNSDMYRWLQQDLQENQSAWLIAVAHHPPYSKGSHDSDRWRDSWGRLVQVRENFVPLLEQQGVDLMLSGHSHMYERSNLLDCHYGNSFSLHDSNIVSHDEAGQYRKHDVGLSPHSGTVYAVVGSSAKLDEGPLNHAAMARSLHQRGALVVEINHNSLTAVFVNEQGQIGDQFSIIKGEAAGVRGRQNCHARD